MVDNELLFSCVISVLNGERYLKETLESIKNQTIGNEKIQMILIDDGSTDNTLAIMEEYKKSFGQVDIIINEKNIGVGASFNKGMEKSKGKYTFFFGGDDLMDSNVLEEVYKFFETNDVEMISVFIKRFGEDSNPMPRDERFSLGNRVIDITKEYMYPQVLNGGCFFKTEKLVGRRYNEKLNHFADGDFMFKFVEDYKQYAVLNTAKIYYRIKTKDESLSRKTKNSEYIYSTIIKESLVKLVDYSRERNNNKVSKYLQTALANRLSILIKRTKYQKEFSKPERIEILNNIKYIVNAINEDIILENKALNFSEKSILLNIKDEKNILEDNFLFKDNKFYYKNKLLKIVLKDTFDVKKEVTDERVKFKIKSNFFQQQDIVIKVDRKIPFLKRIINNVKVNKKKYFFEGYGEFELRECTLSFSRKLPYPKKRIYLYVGEEKIVFKV